MELTFSDKLAYGVSGLLVVGGLTLITAALWRGWLRGRALIRGPRRDAGVTGVTLLLAIAVWLVGSILFSSLMQATFAGSGQALGDLSRLSPEQQAVIVPAGQLLTQGLAAALVVGMCLRRPGGLARFGLRGRRPLRTLGAGLWAGVGCLCVTAVVGMVVAMISTAFGHEPPVVDHVILHTILRSPPLWVIVSLALSTIVLAPLLEEILFRGLIQTVLLHYLGRWRRPVILAMAGALFAFIHLGAVSWLALPSLFVLGILFGAVYERTGNLWIAIIAHAVFNAFQLGYTVLLLPREASPI